MTCRRFNKPLQPRIELEDSGAIEKQHKNKHRLPSLQSCLQTGTGGLIQPSHSGGIQNRSITTESDLQDLAVNRSAADLHGHVLKAPENWERPGTMISNQPSRHKSLHVFSL